MRLLLTPVFFCLANALVMLPVSAEVILFDFINNGPFDGGTVDSAMTETVGAESATLTIVDIFAPEYLETEPESGIFAPSGEILSASVLAANPDGPQLTTSIRNNGTLGINNTISSSQLVSAGGPGTETTNINFEESVVFAVDRDVFISQIDFSSLDTGERFEVTVGEDGETFDFAEGVENDVFNNPFNSMVITAGTPLTFAGAGSLEVTSMRIASISVQTDLTLTPGDFTLDGVVDDADVDLLSFNLGNAATTNPAMDLNGNQTIDLADHDQLITTLVQDANGTGALIGDLNLDGDVDVSEISIGPDGVVNVGDASVLLAGLGTETEAGYADGDLNGDGDIDVSQIAIGPGGVTNEGDASILLANLGQSTATPTTASAVPEPSSLTILALAGIACRLRRQKK